MPFFTKGQSDSRLTPIKAPSSPSSIIIGSQSNGIARPKSWQAVETSLISNYFNENGNIIIPKDYSIEITPYWFNSKRKIEMGKYLNPSYAESFFQNSSFSISSTKNFIIKDTIKTDAIGFGFRTMIWQGTKDKQIDKQKVFNIIMDKDELSQFIVSKVTRILEDTSLKNKDTLINRLILVIYNDTSILKGLDSNVKSNWIEALKKNFKLKLSNNLTNYDEEISNILDDFLKIDDYILKLTAMQKDRDGFRLELASAVALNFPTSSVNFSYAPKYGIWLTPSYQDASWTNFEILGVARLIWNDQEFNRKYLPSEKVFDRNYDYGLRFVYKNDKLSIEAEIIGRYSDLILERTKDSSGIITTRSENKSDIQYLLNFNYRISDAMVLSYNIGKKFDYFTGTNNNLISLVTLNYGIGAPMKSNLITK